MRVLNKKLFRTLMKSPGQSAAVMLVVLCGTACYICVASAYRNLELTKDTYYAAYRFADFEIHLERAPEAAVRRVEELAGVRQARGRIVKEVNVDIAGQEDPRIARIVSMPDRREPVLNDVAIVEGRYFAPGAQNEALLSERFARENGIALGDTIAITAGDRKQRLRVAGFALSPEYVYMIRNVQELIPAPERFGILWVSEDFAEMALDMRAARNNIIGSVDDPAALDRLLDDAEKLLQAYGVYATVKREDQISNRFLEDEIQELGVLAGIVPAQFQGIAALILLVLLNRLVRTERTQIGLMKAFGYSNLAIAWHYVLYALILAFTGAAGGFVAGQWLAHGLVQLYVEFFQFPLFRSEIYPDILFRSLVIALAFALLGAIMAAYRAARLHPAESMRAEAPKFGHRVWLERWPGLWRRLGFTEKMTARNLSRSGLRAVINVAGVSASTGILIMGYFLSDSMDYAFHFQFHEIQREDLKISFQSERGRATWYETMRLPHVRRAEPILEYPFEMRAGWRKKDAVVIGALPGSELQRLIGPDGESATLGDHGLVLSERLAEDLGVGPGGRVTLKPRMGRIEREHEVAVRAVVTQYFGASAYMNLEALSRLLEEPFAMNAALIRTDTGMERALNTALKDVAGIASIVIREDAYRAIVDTLAESMRIMNAMLVLFAGLIAFAVIYNVTAVSLAERQRELSSLRVLGLTPGEVGRVLYYENILLACIGIAIGIPVGMGLSWLILQAFDTDLYRLPFHIEGATYTRTILLIAGFVALANLATWRKLRKADIIEVLKERE